MRRSEFLASAAASTVTPSVPRSVLRLDAAPSGHDIDPYRDAEPGIGEIAWLYADGLTGWDRGLVPVLAESLPEVFDAGSRYRYRLREVRWHDGKDLSATDVVHALDTVKNGVRSAAGRVSPSRWSTFDPYRSVDKIVVLNSRSFDVVLHAPFPDFVRSFFSPYGSASLPLLRSGDGALPIGTGPFSVRERVDFNRWGLERARTSPRGEPRVDVIDVRYLFNPQFGLAPLLAGETDIAIPIPGNAPRDARYRRVSRTTGTTLIIFNAQGTFGDAALRRAFAKTVDVDRLRRVYDPRNTFVPSTFLLDGRADAALTQSLRFDPGAGRRLKAGLHGSVVRILSVPQGSAYSVGLTVRQALTRVGVASELVVIPYSGLYGADSRLRRGDFDITINSYAYAEHPDLAADWGCAQRAPHGGNFARWCDPEFDRAMRNGNLRSALRRLYDEVVAIPLSLAHEDIGLSRRLCGFRAPSMLGPATYSCTSWRLC